MAREHAKIQLCITEDPHYLDLSVDAQYLYAGVFLIDSTLSYCGVVDWRPNRLTQRARDLTLDRIMTAAAELEREWYVLFDPDTEEALVRSFIRNDKLLRNPKMGIAVVKAYQATASRTLRAAVVSELHKALEENPDYPAWTNPISSGPLSRLLGLPQLKEADYTNRITNAITNQIGNGIGNQNTNGIGNAGTVLNTNGIGEVDPGADYQCDSVDFLPATTTTTATTTPRGGSGPDGHLSDEAASPTPHCPNHPEGTDAPCRACGDARQALAAWKVEQRRNESRAKSTEAQERAQVRALAIVECGLCDDDGYAGLTLCDHDPDSADRAKRGSALVRAALTRDGAA